MVVISCCIRYQYPYSHSNKHTKNESEGFAVEYENAIAKKLNDIYDYISVPFDAYMEMRNSVPDAASFMIEEGEDYFDSIIKTCVYRPTIFEEVIFDIFELMPSDAIYLRNNISDITTLIKTIIASCVNKYIHATNQGFTVVRCDVYDIKTISIDESKQHICKSNIIVHRSGKMYGAHIYCKTYHTSTKNVIISFEVKGMVFEDKTSNQIDPNDPLLSTKVLHQGRF